MAFKKLHHDYLIIANGDFLPKEIILAAAEEMQIVALDGAAIRLEKLGILPHLILGDFDSIPLDNTFGIKAVFEDIHNASLPYDGLQQTKIIPAKNQLKTDLQKAIDYCDQEQANSITIICAMGGRIDHQEGNIRTLRTAYQKNRLILLHTEQHTLRFAKDETVIMQGEIGDKCGILAYPAGRFSSLGLEYEADNVALEFGYADSTCNRLMRESAVVTVSGEALLVMPPLLQTQRDFTALNQADKLRILLRDALAT